MLGLRATTHPSSNSPPPSASKTPVPSIAEVKTSPPNGLAEALTMNGQESTDQLSVLKKGSSMANELTKQGHRITSSASDVRSNWSESRAHFSIEQQITVVRETVKITRGKLITEIEHVDEHYIDSLTIERFLDYIERERLTHMPARGSKWDWLLKWAEFFALQISGYAKIVSPFVPDAKEASKLIYASCRSLLELGPDNATALETTFSVFYKLGLSLSFFLRHNALLNVTGHIRTEVGQAFNDLLKFVSDVSIHYRVSSAVAGAKGVRISFTGAFGSYLDSFYKRKDHIINAMWEYRLGGQVTEDIKILRKWLSPRDPMIHSIINQGRGLMESREEFTCEWFQRPLLDFSRSKDDTFEVIGQPGSGKSVIFGWILERLQRPLGKKTHQTLSFKFESDIRSQTSGLAAVKSLALQLLEKNIGDTHFFNALMKVYKGSAKAPNLEESVWEAVATGLNSDAAKGDHYMIIVDGLNRMKNGTQDANRFQGHLSSLAAKCPNLQAVTLTTESPSNNKTKSRTLKITPDLSHEDIRRVTEKAMSVYTHFKDQSEFEEESIVEQLLHAAKGDFTWSLLTAESLKQHESSHSEFTKAVKKIKESPKSVPDMIQNAINALDFNKRETRLIFAWLSVAERPLTLNEVKCLLQVGLSNKNYSERSSELIKDIHAACGPLVIVQDDFVRFRFPVVRTQVLKLQAEGKKIMGARAAQADLVSRLVAYCKFMLASNFELLVEVKDVDIYQGLFKKHDLLDYAVRNWIGHFRASSMFVEGSKGFQLTGEFKALFPSSAQLAILEWVCWDSPTWMLETVETHTLALQVRQTVFTEKHESVLQTLVLCGHLHRKLSHVTESGNCFYRACTLGRDVLRQYHSFLTTCGTWFLSITETYKSTTRTEIITHKETILKYIIESSKHHHGKTSDIVIRYYKMLAELYVEIHEEERAKTCWRELHEIIIIRHGKGSKEEREISEKITVIIKPGDKEKDVIEYEKSIFEIVSVMTVWNERRVKYMLELAASYEKRGEYFMAEEIYITVWRRLIERAGDHHYHGGVEIHIITIDVVLEYVRFLRRRSRHEEACNVLICIWTSYEEFEFESEELFLRLKIIGELMRVVGMLTMAITVFKKCLTWFSFRGHHEHVKVCETLISEVSVEIVKKTTTITTTRSTSTTTTTTTETHSETVIRETFERCLTQTVTVETITIFKSMISYYMKLEQWSEAIECIKKSLTLMWKMILVSSGTVCALPDKFSHEAIEIAISLAICHIRSHHFYEAEEIYVRIFRACRNSCHIHDERVTRAYTVLIAFYEEHRHWHKMIEVYQELLVEFRTHLGASHKRTIEVLYILGSLCEDHGHGKALDYYEEIIIVLSGQSKVCHHDAFKAMKIVCRIYYEHAHWQKLKVVCENLWNLFHHHHHEFTFEAEFVELLYARYRYVLEYHFHCEYETLRSITIIYRDITLKIFGAVHVLYVKALLEFAHICMRSEKHIHEAVETYEKVLTISTTTKTTTTTTKTVITTEQITKIKTTLVHAYATICERETVTKETITRAITIVHEHFEMLKIKFGWAHVETLRTCRKLVLLYLKLKTEEAHSHIKKILVDVSVEIIIKETHSSVLNTAARTLGEIFLACGMAEYGLSLVRELRRQIVTGSDSPRAGFTCKLPKTVGKVSFVFLVTLQETLERTVVSRYATLLSEIYTEVFLYERYRVCIKSSKIEEILLHTAHLRAFLIKHSRRDQVQEFEQHVFGIFLEKYSSVIKVRREIAHIFYVCILEQIVVEGTTLNYAACISTHEKIKTLLEQGKYNDALEVATCTFKFLSHQHFYHDVKNIGYGFKLSGLMALRGVKVSDKGVDAKLREQMLELSRTIIRDVFKACDEAKIELIRLKPKDLDDLVGLLGDQENYQELEVSDTCPNLTYSSATNNNLQRLLGMLWESREIQKNWSLHTIVAVGRRLVEAKFLNPKDKSGAIKLCETICYNLRSLYSSLHPSTLEMSDLLCQLYTSAGHYREAMGVHEGILRLIVEGDDDDDSTVDTVSSETAKKHVLLLKQSYIRLGGWDKSAATYKELVEAVINMDEYKGRTEWQNVQSPSKWNVKDTHDESDKFKAPAHWELSHISDKVELGNGTESPAPASPVKKKPGKAAKRASSGWGMGNLFHRLLHTEGDSDDEE